MKNTFPETNDIVPCACGVAPLIYPAQVIINGEVPESIDCDNDECQVKPTTGYLPFTQAVDKWNNLITEIRANNDAGRYLWEARGIIVDHRVNRLREEND